MAKGLNFVPEVMTFCQIWSDCYWQYFYDCQVGTLAIFKFPKSKGWFSKKLIVQCGRQSQRSTVRIPPVHPEHTHLYVRGSITMQVVSSFTGLNSFKQEKGMLIVFRIQIIQTGGQPYSDNFPYIECPLVHLFWNISLLFWNGSKKKKKDPLIGPFQKWKNRWREIEIFETN